MIFIKILSTESRFVTGTSNILSAGMYVCTFQPGKLTGCGSERVHAQNASHEHNNKDLW